MEKISVILPVYRTARCIEELHRRLTATLATTGCDYELLFIDDGSPDDAWPILQAVAKLDPHVKAVRLTRNFGQHPAISAGFSLAAGDALVLMDADLQDRPEDLPVLLTKLSPTVDIVYTAKLEDSESLISRVTSRIYHYVFSRLTRTAIPAKIGTLRVFSRRVLQSLLAYPEYNVLYGPLMFYVGFQFEVVTVNRDARVHGTSGYTFRKRLALAVSSLISYTDIPHRVLVNMGISIILGSVLYSIALVIRYLVSSGELPPGLTLLALLNTFSLGTITLGIGVLGIYIFRVFQEVLRRPRFLVSETLNIDVK